MSWVRPNLEILLDLSQSPVDVQLNYAGMAVVS